MIPGIVAALAAHCRASRPASRQQTVGPEEGEAETEAPMGPMGNKIGRCMKGYQSKYIECI